ncbi:MAG: hypothetical protein CL424_04605 [Acidimicrobiaceae bacterium]|nr:hypothetical protein [Acidimicrobiaceae bacterium]
MGPLVVEFAGAAVEVTEHLTFGRAGELELDSNPHLHRLVGEFVHRDGGWWIRNRGSRLFLSVTGDDGTRVDLAPGGQHLIAVRSGVVRVTAGQARYELTFRTDVPAADTVDVPDSDDLATRPFEAVLTPREVDFLVTFARPTLEGTGGPLPTYVEVADTWGVSPKTLDNTVQSIKRKLRNARLARDEPLETLVRIAISHSLVSASDLEWSQLSDGAPRPASEGPRFAG